MVWQVIVCALWCAGILMLVWLLGAWCLFPLSEKQVTVLFPDGGDDALERQLRANALLRAAGIARGSVYVVTDGLAEEARRAAEIFSRYHAEVLPVTAAQLYEILKMESQYDGARRDDSRHGAKCAVSKSGERL